jgi:hypothetical protein
MDGAAVAPRYAAFAAYPGSQTTLRYINFNIIILKNTHNSNTSIKTISNSTDFDPLKMKSDNTNSNVCSLSLLLRHLTLTPL